MKIGKIAKKLLNTVAPTVATAIGGPFGGLAASVLKTAFGTNDEAEIEKALAAGDPETLVKLRAAQEEMEVRLRELDIQEQELYLDDVADARTMAKERGVKIQAALSAAFVGGYFVLVGILIMTDAFSTMDEFQKGQIAILIGVLSGAVVQILNFWFGTSKGSKDKTEAIMQGAR